MTETASSRSTPRFPGGITRLAFTLCVRGGRLGVEIALGAATHHLHEGGPLRMPHNGIPSRLTGARPMTRLILRRLT